MPKPKRSTAQRRPTSKPSPSLSTQPENQASAAAPSQKGIRLSRSKKPQLIQALITELPGANTNWPVEKQLNWLNMMAMALGVVYGGDAAKRIEGNTKPVELANKPVREPVPSFQPTPKKTSKLYDYPFVIEHNGHALNAKGNRVLPTDVTSAIHDLRGEDGNMGTITWADGSMGLIGADVTIVAAQV